MYFGVIGAGLMFAIAAIFAVLVASRNDHRLCDGLANNRMVIRNALADFGVPPERIDRLAPAPRSCEDLLKARP